MVLRSLLVLEHGEVIMSLDIALSLLKGVVFEITYQDKAIQTDPDNENTIEKILNTMTLFHTKLDTMEKELQNIKSQQHDKKHAELSPSDDSKIPELQGDDGKHRKTQSNSLLNTATGTASTSATKEENKTRYVNTNMTKLFDKPFTPKVQKDIFIPPQRNKTSRYGRNKTVGVKPTKTRTKTDDKSYKAKLYLNGANGKLLQNYRTQISRPQLFKMLRRRQYHSSYQLGIKRYDKIMARR
ncbi:hypothetical protein H5410_030506 [Solanum commersonii]|uniref:Uncharacterized protein n=1 Tax=Solanum commersonii TaxID=4109 RepID=A0A9J5YHK5_SOLCO|nr:hypothetical protein H5410_030506 [Solanum commersonii]